MRGRPVSASRTFDRSTDRSPLQVVNGEPSPAIECSLNGPEGVGPLPSRAIVLVDAVQTLARRTLRLGADVIAVLREHRVRQLEERLAAGTRWQDGDFVFASSIRTPLDSRNVTHALQAALARAGLPRQRFPVLRHAYATLMLDGEELAVISRSLGHATISTTADVYAHLTPAMLERSAARMHAILGRRSEATG